MTTSESAAAFGLGVWVTALSYIVLRQSTELLRLSKELKKIQLPSKLEDLYRKVALREKFLPFSLEVEELEGPATGVLGRFAHWCGSKLPEPEWHVEPSLVMGSWRFWEDTDCAAYRGKWGKWYSAQHPTRRMDRWSIVSRIRIEYNNQKTRSPDAHGVQ